MLRTGIAYTPKETVNYETFVKMLYLEKYAGEKPFEGPVSMLISAFYQIPKSASKRRREAMARHHIPPTTRPDIDNIAKIIMDALAGVAYEAVSYTHLDVYKRQVGGTVLDPFAGSGTTLLVATQHHRKSIGIELNPEYIEIAKRRLNSVQLKLVEVSEEGET